MNNENAPHSANEGLRVLVVDDEWVARNYLTELVEMSRLGTVVAAVATAEQALEALRPGPLGFEVDAVFLDVHLAGGGGPEAGLELAKKLRWTNGAPAVVLATAFGEHALLAYELGVIDYLRKPFTAERVERCLRCILASRPSRAAVPALRRIVARKGKSLVFLRLDDAWAFEASGRLVFVHGARGKLDMDLSLAILDAQLSGQVLRVHRNWLVNVARVLEFVRDGAETYVVVGSNEGDALPPVRVPVTRERAAEIRGVLLERLMVKARGG